MDRIAQPGQDRVSVEATARVVHLRAARVVNRVAIQAFVAVGVLEDNDGARMTGELHGDIPGAAVVGAEALHWLAKGNVMAKRWSTDAALRLMGGGEQ